MVIHLVKFGTVLVSRPAGKEAWLAFQPFFSKLSEDENITVDFSGVAVFTPSWADEFITPLKKKFGKRVILKNTQNASVQTSLKILVVN
jgi:hypothetical protein